MQMTIRGLKKLHLRLEGGKLQLETKLLSSVKVKQLVCVADELGFADVGTFFLVNWSFLLRVASESIPLQAGGGNDLKKLCPRRRSCVFVSNGEMVIRWTRRKHRPRGAVLRRFCSCDTSGKQFCCVCRVEVLLEGKSHGERLWGLKDHATLNQMRSWLGLLGDPDAGFYGWKCFRSGAATELAASGYSLAQVCCRLVIGTPQRYYATCARLEVMRGRWLLNRWMLRKSDM